MSSHTDSYAPLLFLIGLPLWFRPPSSAASGNDAQVFVLIDRSASFYLQASRGFKQNFTPAADVEVSYVDRDPRDLDAEIEELRRSPPSLVVVFGTQAAIAAKSRLHTVPIIYCLALDPVKNDLVGPNVGGVRLEVDLSQQFAELEELWPQVRRIGLIYSEPASGKMVRQARAHLKPGIELIARDPREAAQLVEEIMGQVDAFCLLWDPVIANVSNFRLLVDLSLKNKVALIAPAPPFVEAGALMSVAADGSEAEWIMERPQVNGSYADLAAYMVATMTGASACNADYANCLNYNSPYGGATSEQISMYNGRGPAFVGLSRFQHSDGFLLV